MFRPLINLVVTSSGNPSSMKTARIAVRSLNQVAWLILSVQVVYSPAQAQFIFIKVNHIAECHASISKVTFFTEMGKVKAYPEMLSCIASLLNLP